MRSIRVLILLVVSFVTASRPEAQPLSGATYSLTFDVGFYHDVFVGNLSGVCCRRRGWEFAGDSITWLWDLSSIVNKILCSVVFRMKPTKI